MPVVRPVRLAVLRGLLTPEGPILGLYGYSAWSPLHGVLSLTRMR